MAGVVFDEEFNVESIITRLLAVGEDIQKTKVTEVLSNEEITQLCKKAQDLFLTEPSLFELDSPVNVIGDIRGEYRILLEIFELGGHPSENKYLFLGDYVDSGRHSVEVMSLLLAYKIQYPNQIFLLRGSHECRNISRIYGFLHECKRRYNIKLWKVFCSCFDCLPIAAVINRNILAVHCGISPELNSLDQIRQIERPTDIPGSGLLFDLMWAHPDDSIRGWHEGSDMVSFYFGPDKVEECLKKLGLELIIRSKQVSLSYFFSSTYPTETSKPIELLIDDGYEYLADKKLLSINSRYNAFGYCDDIAGFAVIGSDGTISKQILEYRKKV